MNEIIFNKINERRLGKDQTGILGIDWILLLALLPIVGAGLVAMNAFTGGGVFFDKQLAWASFSLIIFFITSFVDFRFLRRTGVVVSLYLFLMFILFGTAVVGAVVKGAQSWIHFGSIAFEPADTAKLVLIIILAKYFSRRHVEIADIKHIFISGLYAFILFFLIMLQPDFGSAIIVFFIWLGMVFVSGISKRHLLAVFLVGVASFALLWSFVFQPYQKERIVNFIHPLTDIRGSGYNAYQSMIAVGSGELFGKGVGYGTQSRLKFLPEYQTDFIFAAFAEEWGYVGILILFSLYGVVIWRILANTMNGSTNFEILFGMGLAIYFMTHIIIHVGMNIGLLPVTGIPMPFMSYGGTHLLTEFFGLGILMGMRRYAKAFHKDSIKNEFLGPV